MPATAGRVRMPHNNRMTTSATLKTTAIWQKTIGHDPYANAEEKQKPSSNPEADAEKLRNVMEMARNQNVTDGADRNDFTAKMFLGLKRGKQRRVDAGQTAEAKASSFQRMEDPSSSSEDEFVQEEENKEIKRRRKETKKKRRKRREYESSCSSQDDSSSDDSDKKERRRRKREKRKKRKHKRRSYHSDSDSDSEGGRRRPICEEKRHGKNEN